MQASPTAHRQEKLAQKWSELAKRRRDHFVELYKTGRWKHYYTEAEFQDELRKVMQAAEEWERLAGRRPEAHNAG
jgi:uncharacterized repeat protein (TIGR03809 family)